MIFLILLLVLAACEGFLYNEGIWGNLIRLVNVLTAALLATNFWEPLARVLEENVSKPLTYFWDFIALWGLFCVFLIIFRLADPIRLRREGQVHGPRRPHRRRDLRHLCRLGDDLFHADDLAHGPAEARFPLRLLPAG